MRACRQLYDLSTSSPPVEDKPVFVEGGAGLRINRIVTSIEGASFTGKGDKDKVRPRSPLSLGPALRNGGLRACSFPRVGGLRGAWAGVGLRPRALGRGKPIRRGAGLAAHWVARVGWVLPRARAPPAAALALFERREHRRSPARGGVKGDTRREEAA